MARLPVHIAARHEWLGIKPCRVRAASVGEGLAWECSDIVAAILLVTGSQMRTVASRLQLTRPTSGTEPTCRPPSEPADQLLTWMLAA